MRSAVLSRVNWPESIHNFFLDRLFCLGYDAHCFQSPNPVTIQNVTIFESKTVESKLGLKRFEVVMNVTETARVEW